MRTLFKANIICILLCCMYLFSACEDDITDARKNGENRSTSLHLKSDGGTASFNIDTNGSWNVTMAESTQVWASFKGGTSGSGNGSISIEYEANEGFNRLGSILISIPEISVVDTLYLRQYGQLPLVEFVTKDIAAQGFGTKAVVEISTNMTEDQLKDVLIEFNYQNAEQAWINDFKFADDLKTATFEINKNSSYSDRTALINLILTDGLGDKYVSTCTVTQSKASGTENTKDVSFEYIRNLISGASGSLEITEDISITGIVISDCDNPNVAANPNLTQTTIDYNVNYKTAYIQNKEATYGFALTTTTKESNIMHRYDNLTLWLKGLTLVKESDPERYVLAEITNGNYIGLESGNASDLANKEKYIDELTDADLYTFVKLKDCELPIRKGPFTPVNEGYTIAYATYRVDTYPLVVRDRLGGSAYLMTNMACPYRRDGSVLPQGSGTISGIIVHEKYSRFTQNGNIGKYQIRHLSREDIAIDQDANMGFSNIICEFTKFQGTSKIVTPTFGSGELSQTYSAGNIYGTQDFTYLGPITGNTTDDNKGVIPSSMGMGIAKTTWWNNNSGESWVLKFSTAGINSDQLSLQFCAFHNGLGAPRYWVVETSTHGNKEGVWEAIQEYTIPDIVQWGSTLYNQLSGVKNINVSLPASLLGKENVYVRLRVTQNKAGNASSYDGAAINNGAATVLSYVSIRYNK